MFEDQRRHTFDTSIISTILAGSPLYEQITSPAISSLQIWRYSPRRRGPSISFFNRFIFFLVWGMRGVSIVVGIVRIFWWLGCWWSRTRLFPTIWIFGSSRWEGDQWDTCCGCER